VTKPSAHWEAPDFAGRVALVTGASHGAGRGIAHVLGETGATVFVTARRIAPLRETAREVDARGGRGVAVKCDHRDDAQVQDLFARIAGDVGSLDILVNNVVGWGDVGGARKQPWGVPAWEQPLEWWESNFQSTLRAHFVATRLAIPLMLPRKWGLIAFTSERAGNPDITSHLRAVATSQMAANIAKQLRRTGVVAVTICPGWMRTDVVVKSMKGMIARDAASPPRSREPWTWERLIDETESQEFPGRAIAAVAAAPDRLRLSGRTFQTAALAERYGFKDIDGRMPN
jgi:dehydrogenase/reductase SDR family protein 1